MKDAIDSVESSVLMSIHNNKNPEQIVYLVLDESHKHLATEGLKPHFGLKEIRMEAGDIVGALQEYAELLSRIMEMISEAKDLNLPFAYQPEFQFNGQSYTLEEEGDYRILRKGAPGKSIFSS